MEGKGTDEKDTAEEIGESERAGGKRIERERKRLIERERETDRDREKERRLREREIEKERDIYIEREREGEREIETETDIDRERERQRETERDRERQRETERDRERQREKERNKERERERKKKDKNPDKRNHIFGPPCLTVFGSDGCREGTNKKQNERCVIASFSLVVSPPFLRSFRPPHSQHRTFVLTTSVWTQLLDRNTYHCNFQEFESLSTVCPNS